MKSLKTVQTISKVFGILTGIALICTLIGVIGAIVGGSVVLAVPHLSDDLAKMIASEAEIADAKSLGIGLIAESVFLASQAVSLWFIRRYFKNELADGTPFTHRGAKELLKVGIIDLTVPLGGLCVASAILGIAGVETVLAMEYEVVAGLAMLLISFVFRYGADLLNDKEESQA